MRVERAVVDHRDQALDLDVEVALLVHLAQERVLDVLAVLDAAGRQTIGARRIEGLGLQQDAAARTADRHRDLAPTPAAADGAKSPFASVASTQRELAVALAEPAEVVLRAHGAPSRPVTLRDRLRDERRERVGIAAAHAGDLAAGRRRVAAAAEGLGDARQIDGRRRASAGSSPRRSWCRRARPPRSASPCPTASPISLG